MTKLNPAIDTYISKSAIFAQPILNHIRALVHEACPEVEEKMKWSFPHFDYNGEMMCSMAGFKKHCVLNFWKGSLLKAGAKLITLYENHTMGKFGNITSIKDLPPDKLILKMVKEACALNDAVIKAVKEKPKAKVNEIGIPEYFLKALAKNKKAEKIFNTGSFSFKKEYITWLDEAKTEATRNSRMTTALEWIAQGKGRNWKYEKP
ncbi:MAG: DUF1801 domain-containing protein [Saprospiraceae bacterium]